MPTNVKIQMNPTQKILLKRNLNENGEAQIKFTKECYKAMNPYVPFATGRLKDWMIEVKRTYIEFNAPYAAKQFYTNHGKGKQGTSIGGLRGKRWDKRMWADKGDNIVKTIADFCGGRSK